MSMINYAFIDEAHVSTLLEILPKVYKFKTHVVLEVVSTLLEILPLMSGGFLGF